MFMNGSGSDVFSPSGTVGCYTQAWVLVLGESNMFEWPCHVQFRIY